MSTTVKFVSIPSKTLATSINGSASTLQLSDILGWGGVALTSADLGDVLWVVLRDSANTMMEIMQLDPSTIANSSITILKRGLDFSGGTVTEYAANKLTWIKNDTIVELGTNPPQLLNQAVCVTGNQSISDLKTFVTLPQCTAVPTAAADLANKAYVDSVVGGSANYDQNIVNGTAGENLAAAQVAYLKAADGKWYVADSATASKSAGVQLGIVQATVLSGSTALRVLVAGRDKTQTGLTAGTVYYLSTTGAISSSQGTNVRIIGQTPSGSTTDLVVRGLDPASPDVQLVDGSRTYVDDTGAADAYVMTLSPALTQYVKGQRFSFKSIHANATTTPTVNINGLGAKTITKNGGVALAANDIINGQIVAIEYDGTNMQMLSPVANAPATSASLKFGGTGADGALAISSGTTTIDCANAAIVIKNYTSISITGTAVLAFSNPNASGTIIILRSQGGVTLTSSSTPMIDASAMGGAGGTHGATGTTGTTGNFILDSTVHGGVGGQTSSGTAGTGGAALTLPINLYSRAAAQLANRAIFLYCGSGGGGGGDGANSTNGTSGGNGGGALMIECGGALNFTTTGGISVNGANGVTVSSGAGGAGGGGSGGSCVILYSSLTSATGTVTSTGGTGGTSFAAGGTSQSGGGGGGAGGFGGAGGAGGAGGNNGAGTVGTIGAGAGAGGGGGGGSTGVGTAKAGGAGVVDTGAGLITQNFFFV